MRKCVGLVSSLVLALFVSTPVFANLSGSDDFAFEDLTKWIKFGSFDGSVGGQIQNSNGQAVYSAVDSQTDDDVAGYVWQLNDAVKSTSWEAMVDVFMPDYSLAGNQYTDLAISVIWPNPLPSLDPQNFAGISLSQNGATRGFYTSKKTGLIEEDLVFAPTTTTAGSLRIAWNAGTEMLSFFYDPDGGQDSWNLLASTDIVGWNIQDTDAFSIAIFGGSGNISIDPSQMRLALDNFHAATVPEPSAMLLFGFGIVMFLRKRLAK